VLGYLALNTKLTLVVAPLVLRRRLRRLLYKSGRL
jgi:hypothetical protein